MALGDMDDFWDIEKLVPKKFAPKSPNDPKGEKKLSGFSTSSAVSDYSVPGVTAEESTSEERRLSLKPASDRFEEENYTPDWCKLIKTVKIRNYRDRYDFYDSFRRSAELYFDVVAQKCDYTPFYSYMPQYSQLGREQKNYYFFWRDELRRGRFIRTDYSYLYLFVYEILNLPDRIPPQDGIKLLCELWKRYRDELPRIDANFVVWIQDYCLIHKLACPTESLSGFIYDIVNASNFKEFYLSDISTFTDDTMSVLIAYLSDYDWRRGRYSSGEHAKTYRHHMEGAMRRILLRLLKDESFISLSPSTAVISRGAFPNSLCTHSVKRNIEVEYYPISHSHTVRRIVTESVRYTENKLRGFLGIKSRLSVKGLEDEYKRLIDTYFDRIASDERKKSAIANKPEYEKLYEAPKEAISSEDADEIERLSWSVTARLVAESETDEPVADSTVKKTSSAEEVFVDSRVENTSLEAKDGLCDDDVRIVRESLLGAVKESLGTDSAVERINEAFIAIIGDIILEYGDGGYQLIKDYREDVQEWLKKTEK